MRFSALPSDCGSWLFPHSRAVFPAQPAPSTVHVDRPLAQRRGALPFGKLPGTAVVRVEFRVFAAMSLRRVSQMCAFWAILPCEEGLRLAHPDKINPVGECWIVSIQPVTLSDPTSTSMPADISTSIAFPVGGLVTERRRVTSGMVMTDAPRAARRAGRPRPSPRSRVTPVDPRSVRARISGRGV